MTTPDPLASILGTLTVGFAVGAWWLRHADPVYPALLLLIAVTATIAWAGVLVANRQGAQPADPVGDADC